MSWKFVSKQILFYSKSEKIWFRKIFVKEIEDNREREWYSLWDKWGIAKRKRDFWERLFGIATSIERQEIKI